jgi:uncharacterized protein
MEFAATQGLVLAALGLVVGVLVGATGVGAGSLTTPALVLGFGVNPLIAVGTDLLFATVTKSAGAISHHKLGSIDTRILGWLAAGSLPAAALTLTALARFTGDIAGLTSLIKLALGVVLLITAAALLLRPYLKNRFEPQSAATLHTPWAKLTAIGAMLGSLVALTSIGAGSLGIVALSLAVPSLLTRRIIGTDIAHAIPLTLLCGLGHLAMGHVNAQLLGLLLMGSLPGVWIGSYYSVRVPEPVLRWLLACVLLLAAVLLLGRLLLQSPVAA